MDEYELPYSTVSLEITETAAVISGDLLWHNMQKLEEKGIHFAMDDYGTGYSNTASIIKYPFHTIKLDKSMLWSAMDNDKAMCALKHTSAMIKDMKMELLAEGVETLEQAELLEGMGCDLFQGYYYSKPLCEKDFLEKIG
jgi:EAL domain-containing protein (putative c-di-GMP-specific phosphodiesterase class I)